MNKFEDFIFTDSLSDTLRYWLETTNIHPLCFYGTPGNGKTSFAKYISNKKGNSVMYRDCNDVKSNFKTELNAIDGFARTISLFSDNEVWDKVLVLDEFHNLTDIQMDYFKVRFEQWNDSGIQIIICCNTGRKVPIENTITPAMRSRFELISFDIYRSQLDEMVSKVLNKYPQLEEQKVYNLLPDMRKITKSSKLYKTDALTHFAALANAPVKAIPKKVKTKIDTLELVFDE